MTCAYRLWQAGYRLTVYEANSAIGGRTWTIRGLFADGQIAEHGGELIDTAHKALLSLAKELGLNTVDLIASEENRTEETYYFNRGRYTYAQASADYNAVYQALHKDVSAASYPTLYNLYTPRGYELDHMSIIDWIDQNVPGGSSSRFGKLLDVAYNIEYGAESDTQSALNMLYLIGYSGQGQFRIFGPSDERYHIVGGNDQVVARIGAILPPASIVVNSPLVALAANGDDTYTCTFEQSPKTISVTADRVVLALPFTMLRNVDSSKAGFEPLKVTAIENLPMGTNSKLHLQFNSRLWNGLGYNGSTFADTGYQNTWEVSRGQAGTSGILVDYTGGDVGASYAGSAAHGIPSQRVVNTALKQLEPVYRVTHAYNGRAYLDYWLADTWHKGSYSYWRVGQYTTFAGKERERQGKVHFCGEHTSVDFQGYINGGVESGNRVAFDEILADYKGGIFP
ncbi:MAG TPA: NAD(P)/FAD-dependent oxidoreductase [Actinomycetota bacterium]|jgi:monoamine oxidase